MAVIHVHNRAWLTSGHHFFDSSVFHIFHTKKGDSSAQECLTQLLSISEGKEINTVNKNSAKNSGPSSGKQ